MSAPAKVAKAAVTVAAAASAAPEAAKTALRRLVCSSMGTLAARLPERGRLLGLDVSPTHVSLSVSDSERSIAAPFGVVRRTGSATRDGAVLRSAFDRGGVPSDLHGVVIGCGPGSETVKTAARYVQELLSDEALLPQADSLLFYSEVTALKNAVKRAEDVRGAAAQLEHMKESRKPPRFEAAMYPTLDGVEYRNDRDGRASISACDILQSALDDLSRVNRTNVAAGGGAGSS